MRTHLDFTNPYRTLSSPFTLGPDQRPLKVFIDRATLKVGLPTSLLDEFLKAPDCEITTTKVGDSDRLVFDDPKNDIQPIRLLLDEGYIQSGVWPLHTWEHFAKNPIVVEGSSLTNGPWNDYRYRLERYLLVNLAHRRQTDLYVTDDRFLLEYSPQDFLKVNVVSSKNAIALMGAHLRNRHHYLVKSSMDGGFTASLDQILFYMLARNAIFNTNVCPEKKLSTAKEQKLTGLCQALWHRCIQLLKSRDFALFQLLQPHNNQTTDDALYHFDMFLLVMGGMFDLLAQIVDVALNMETPHLEISWHRKDWIKNLRHHDCVLAKKVAAPNPYNHTLRLHAILRNTIHGPHLSSIHYTNNAAPTEGLVIVPQVHKRDALFLFNSSGGSEHWGVVDSHDGDLWIRPGTLMECLLAEGCELVNGICAHLSGDRNNAPVQLQEGKYPFDAETEERVKCLAGLADVTR